MDGGRGADGEEPRPFLLGLGSFLAAHVTYISAYRSRSSTSLLETPAQQRALGADTVAALAAGVAAGRQDRALAVPVATYGGLESTSAVAVMLSYLAAQWCVSEGMLRGARTSTTSARRSDRRFRVGGMSPWEAGTWRHDGSAT